MFGMNKKFWLMWANDDGHSPPTEVHGKNEAQVAKAFMEDWPAFDGQVWIFKCKPSYSMEFAGHKPYAEVKSGILNRFRRRR